jgi:hypothetical protein
MLLERASYHGGRVEAWHLGKLPEACFKLDVNSLYPSRMRESAHPVKLLRLYPSSSPQQLAELAQKYFVIADVTLTTSLPIVPVRRERLLFPVGTFQTVLTSHELGLVDARNIVAVRGVAAYESGYLFRDFVDFFYTARVAAKAAGELAKAEIFKLLMNSLYGKFGQQSTEWVRLGEADPSAVGVEDILLPNGRTVRLRTFGGATWINDGAVMESFESFPAIAASVTSAARALLWNYITVAGIENVYYMDTDSLFVNERGYSRLCESGVVHPTQLGSLKLEGSSDDVEIFGAKQYRFGESTKHKGIPKDAELITDSDGVTRAKVWMWPKVATWLREGKLDGFENRAVLKSISTTYTKGKATVSGRVEPLEIVA